MLEVMFRESIQSNAREYVWKPLGESNGARYIRKTIKCVDGHLTVWGCISEKVISDRT